MEFNVDFEHELGAFSKQVMTLDHGWCLWYVRYDSLQAGQFQLRRDHVIVPVSREYVSRMIDKMVPEV